MKVSTIPAPSVRFTTDNESGKSQTFGLFLRDNGTTIQFVAYSGPSDQKYTTIAKFNEQSLNLQDVAYEVAATIFEISEMETEEESDDCLEIATAMLAPFSTIYNR